jgi:hypothetical protein
LNLLKSLSIPKICSPGFIDSERGASQSDLHSRLLGLIPPHSTPPIMGIKPLASPSYSPSRSSLERTLKCPVLFSLISILLLYLYSWPQRWLISGAPILQVFILLGDYHGNRILPDIHIWPIFTTLHLIYAISSTSWLLYWVFAGLCYPAIFLVCLFQFRVVSNGVRRGLRSGLKHLHFIDDKIAFFSIPALEIDNEVDGLMVLRGITFSLSSLSFVVHGAEVGIKLSNDMELAIQSEEVTVYLFRGIDIGDCFANLKGGRYEMTFGELEGKSKDADGDEVFVEGTPLLKAASRGSDGRSLEINEGVQEKKGKMKDEMTNGSSPEATSAKEGLESIEKLSPDDEEAAGRYQKHISFIEETSSIYEAKENVKRLASKNPEFQSKFSAHDTNPLRAAICSQLHSKPSVPHPPQKSIKVTTLQNLMPPAIRAFIHRLPMLLRLLLNPLAYFHPVKITSITATASGQWLDSLLVSKLFQDYGEHDSEIRNLKSRISSWLSDANFAIELGAITGLAQVPFIPTYDITCQLIFNDVMAYRALPKHVDLKQVVRLGGADAKSLRLCSAYTLAKTIPHHS